MDELRVGSFPDTIKPYQGFWSNPLNIADKASNVLPLPYIIFVLEI